MLRLALLTLVLSAITAGASGQYFPKRVLATNPASDQLKTQWYSTMLEHLQEPSLLAQVSNPSIQVYRFLWLRSFHHPIAVRLDVLPDGTGKLTTKITSGAGGYSPGHMLENTTRTLSEEETHAFVALVERVHFWRLPNPVNDQRGTDGSQWIIEAVGKGRYKVVDRWSPSVGPVRQLGEMLAFRMAGIVVPEREDY